MSFISFLYTEIGRGHPFYLDGIYRALLRSGQTAEIREVDNVFKVSKGLSLLAWKSARFLYRYGSSGGLTGQIYRRLRRDSDYNRPSRMIEIMARDIRGKYQNSGNLLLVAHPILVAVLKKRKNLIYQHGEIITPPEAVVGGAEIVVVPIDAAARPFIDFGYRSEQIIISGLCIEDALVRQADDAYKNRLNRLSGLENLTGAFYSSGAEPMPHIRTMKKALIALLLAGNRAIVFALAGGKLLAGAVSAAQRAGVDFTVCDAADSIPLEFNNLLIVTYKNRREEDHLTSVLFRQFDYLVAPAHERTNWAVGLGLPLFTVGPHIGPFAPLNFEFMINQGVTIPIEHLMVKRDFAASLTGLHREGRLNGMAINGYKAYEINGFSNIATFLINKREKN